MALKEPKTFPEEQRRVFRAPDLREILRVFNGEECYPSGCRRASLMEGKWVGGTLSHVFPPNTCKHITFPVRSF